MLKTEVKTKSTPSYKNLDDLRQKGMLSQEQYTKALGFKVLKAEEAAVPLDVKLAPKIGEEKQRSCKYCEKPFPASTKHLKYCSVTCKDLAQNNSSPASHVEQTPKRFAPPSAAALLCDTKVPSKWRRIFSLLCWQGVRLLSRCRLRTLNYRRAQTIQGGVALGAGILSLSHALPYFIGKALGVNIPNTPFTNQDLLILGFFLAISMVSGMRALHLGLNKKFD